jgi:hypothetical protein
MRNELDVDRGPSHFLNMLGGRTEAKWIPRAASASFALATAIMLGILYTLTLFWICVHGIQLYYGRNPHASSLLPSAHAVKARWYSRMSWRRMEVIIRPLNINVSSTYFNKIHNRLELYFRQQDRLWSRWMTRLYDVGIVLGVVGQISAVVLVAFTAVQLSLSLLASAQDSVAMEIPRVVATSHLKRQVEEITTTVTSGTQTSSNTLLQPIVRLLGYLGLHAMTRPSRSLVSLSLLRTLGPFL